MHTKTSRRSILIISSWLATGCGYYLVPGRFQPLESSHQSSGMAVRDDGSITYVQDRLEVSVRLITDEELNRQFPSMSIDGGGPADELPTNAFTFGNWESPRTEQPPQRFAVVKVTVKNYQYPKVKLDPLKTVIHSGNGRSYYPWGDYDFEEYFRRFPLAFNGLGYQRFSQRKDMIRRARYPGDGFCFSGQEVEGYIVFPRIHDDVEEITFHIFELGLRYNFRDEPTETADLDFRFKRNIRKVKNLDELAVHVQ